MAEQTLDQRQNNNTDFTRRETRQSEITAVTPRDFSIEAERRRMSVGSPGWSTNSTADTQLANPTPVYRNQMAEDFTARANEAGEHTKGERWHRRNEIRSAWLKDMVAASEKIAEVNANTSDEKERQAKIAEISHGLQSKYENSDFESQLVFNRAIVRFVDQHGEDKTRQILGAEQFKYLVTDSPAYKAEKEAYSEQKKALDEMQKQASALIEAINSGTKSPSEGFTFLINQGTEFNKAAEVYRENGMNFNQKLIDAIRQKDPAIARACETLEGGNVEQAKLEFIQASVANLSDTQKNVDKKRETEILLNVLENSSISELNNLDQQYRDSWRTRGQPGNPLGLKEHLSQLISQGTIEAKDPGGLDNAKLIGMIFNPEFHIGTEINGKSLIQAVKQLSSDKYYNNIIQLSLEARKALEGSDAGFEIFEKAYQELNGQGIVAHKTQIMRDVSKHTDSSLEHALIAACNKDLSASEAASICLAEALNREDQYLVKAVLNNINSQEEMDKLAKAFVQWLPDAKKYSNFESIEDLVGDMQKDLEKIPENQIVKYIFSDKLDDQDIELDVNDYLKKRWAN